MPPTAPDTGTPGRAGVPPADLPGCATAGDTEEEAVANATEALTLWFDPAPIDLPKNAKLLEDALEAPARRRIKIFYFKPRKSAEASKEAPFLRLF
jgi:predicted RNase H-like HicB family nuclease